MFFKHLVRGWHLLSRKENIIGLPICKSRKILRHYEYFINFQAKIWVCLKTISYHINLIRLNAKRCVFVHLRKPNQNKFSYLLPPNWVQLWKYLITIRVLNRHIIFYKTKENLAEFKLKIIMLHDVEVTIVL